MSNLNKVFSSITLGTSDSVRGIAGSALASGAPVDVGVSMLPKTKEITISGGADFVSTGASQPERAQVNPSTTNKVPRIYGNVVTGGVVVDAQKTNANTVFVTFALSVTDALGDDQVINNFDSADLGPPWGIYEIYRNNQVCEMKSNVFTLGNAEPHGASASSVQILSDIADPNSNTNISSANVINVWAWQHTATATNQIFPYYPPGSSYRRPITAVMPNRTSTYSGAGLVTVVVEVDKDDALDIRDFGRFRFKVGTRGYYEKQANGTVISNLVSNPATALQDYVEALGYGEFILNDGNLDQASFDEWKAYCNETYYYGILTGETDVLGGTLVGTYGAYDVYSTPRWQINGFINTQNALDKGINNIAEAGQGSFTYDIRTAKFRVLVNRPITNAEGANAFVFNNDNIVSGIQYNSTDLYSLFNYADVTFPNVQQQDTADALIVKTPTADKLVNELPSGMNFQVNTVNDRPRAAQMANSSLKASRVANMATFEADYSTLDVRVGDFVKIQDKAKGWENKIFKVMRISERQSSDAEVTLSYNVLEHFPSTYEPIIYEATANKPFANGLGTVENLVERNQLSFVDQYAAITMQIPQAVTGYMVVDNPSSGVGNVYNGDGTLDTAGVAISTLATTANIAANYPEYNLTSDTWMAVRAFTNSAVAFDYSKVTFTGDASEDSPAYNTTEIVSPYINSVNITEANVWTPFKLDKVTSGTYSVSVSAYKQEAVRQRSSQANVITVTIDPVLYNEGNALVNTYGPGTFLEQIPVMTTIPATGTSQISQIKRHDLIDISLAEDFEFTYNYTPTWSSIAANTAEVTFGVNASITFVNASNTSTKVFAINGGGIQFNPITTGEAVALLNQPQTHTIPFSGKAEYYGLDTDEWYASYADVSFIGSNGGTGGAFNNVSYTMRSQNRFYRT